MRVFTLMLQYYYQTVIEEQLQRIIKLEEKTTILTNKGQRQQYLFRKQRREVKTLRLE